MIASIPPTDADDNADDNSPSRAAPRFKHFFPFALGAGLGLLIALAIALGWALLNRDVTPVLTEETLAAAAALWERKAPPSYNLELAIGGRRAGVVHVEVRDGDVTAMTRDGHQPSQERTWYPWSVPGQFDTMAQELEMARKPAEHFQTSGGAQVRLRARFDPRYGYPLSFERMVLGSDDEIRWKTTRFEVFGGKK